MSKVRRIKAQITNRPGYAWSRNPQFASGYGDAGASMIKRALKAFKAQSFSPIEDIDFHNTTLRQRGRMLYMASPIAAAAINTARTKVVGPGLQMKCNINAEILGLSGKAAKKWCKWTEAEFKAWCESKNACDALGMSNFYELQQLAFKAWHMSGDTFALLKQRDISRFNPYSLCIQLVEADRICTPDCVRGGWIAITEGEYKGNKVHDGVEVDKNGRVVAYHVCSTYPSPLLNEEIKWTRVEAVNSKTGISNVLHIMDAERPDQYRGITYLAPVIEMLLQNRRYTESELTAAIIQTYFTGWISTKTDASSMPILGEDENEDYDNEPEMSPGNIIHLKNNETIEFGNPNIPTAGYDKFTSSIVKQIGAGLEQPHEVMMKEFTKSYSASKGALEEAWETFKMRRSWFVNDFCQPVYEAFLAEAVARGRISAPGFFDDPIIRAAWCGARWDGPAQTQLDSTKEAQANEILVKNGWKTNEQVTREYYGGNWEDNIQALAAERELFKALIPDIALNDTVLIQEDKENDEDEKDESNDE